MKLTKLTIQLIVLLSLFLSPVYSFAAETNTNLQSQNHKNKLTKTINDIRTEQGLRLLATSSKLMEAAQSKAEDMARNAYFAHTSPDGVSPWHWFYEAGYRPRIAGENLALSYSLKSNIVQAWLDSPSHKKNIMKDAYTETGFGIAEGSYRGHRAYYIVELFGSL